MSDYAAVKAWRKRNPDKVAAQARRYRRRHPDKISVIKSRYRSSKIDEIRKVDAERQAQRRASDPAAQRRRNAAYLKRQNERKERIAGRPRAKRCELCERKARTVFDHCHSSGRFRGWICDRCNRVLGSVKDSPELLVKMIAYLEKEHGKTYTDRAEQTQRKPVRSAGEESVSG